MTAKQYQAIIRKLIKEHDITVVKYYNSFQGNALIEEKKIWIPKPVCETSFYIALHEIGHVISGLDSTKQPNWLHEYEATRYALEQAKMEGIDFSEEMIQAIRGYLKSVLCDEIMKTFIDEIPNKVFQLAGCNKYYWRKKIIKGYKFLRGGEIHVGAFRQWKNFKVMWM
jgi:hypothetical protein